ncbi:InlB B-repeat-containing protein [Gordonibacter massiliensis (ex Traore et al. 2017)]|uniref:InlB B-repeat-containing protein n=1 Tax=Gordonibacter massiliensis (ex Traore et al. 2017) TaxID=1841863 RepID=UPI001C8B9668|nr:InlB B-repeat-containing protein [Gordonibacter massiliensis (ex Traore et al. 2017)]MBX9035182.1 LPXTG cell wall anchor domain-containing protein [Gordonibacter massiliensis (ex Traore et al. 2017)]
MHTIRALSPSPPARRALAALLALLLALSMLPLSAFADQGAASRAPLDPPPDHFQAQALSSSTILLTWDPVTDAQSIGIYRYNPVSDDYDMIDEVGSDTTFYIDQLLEANTTYYYAIDCCKDGVRSYWSDFIGAKTLSDKVAHELTYYCVYPDGLEMIPVLGGSFFQDDSVTLPDISSVGGEDWSRSDLRFLGWRNAADGLVYQAGTRFSMPDEAAELQAVWEAPNKVTYLGNGAVDGTVPVDNQKYFPGDPVTVSSLVPASPKPELTFSSWLNSATGHLAQPGDTFVMPESDVVLFALWADNADAGKNALELDKNYLRPGEAVSFTATGDRQDAVGGTNGETRYLPMSWTIEPLHRDVSFSHTFPFTESVVIQDPGTYTLKAFFVKQAYDSTSDSWKAAGGNATLTTDFVVREAQQTNPVLYRCDYPIGGGGLFEYGGDFAASDHVTLSDITSVGTNGADWSRPDLKFVGWQDEFGQVMSAGTEVLMPDRPLELTAVWEIPHQVLYLGNGANPDSVPVDSQSHFAGDLVAVSPNIPVWPGHTFTGWLSLTDNLTYQPGDMFAMPENDVLLLAQWSGQSGASEADADKNTLVLDNDVLYLGEPVSFTATGDRQDAAGVSDGDTRYVPVTWTVDPFSDIPFTDRYPFTGSVIALNLGVQSVTVTFDKQIYNVSLGNWVSTGETATLSEPFIVLEQTNPLTYHRNFAPDDPVTANGGDFASNVLVPLSDITSVGGSEDWNTRSDYRFLGWSEDPTNAWGITTWYPMPDKPLDLYAVWGLLYPVTYDGDGADGGTVPVDDNKYVVGDLVDVSLDTPTKTGYTFGGWLNTCTGRVHQPGTSFYMTEDGANLKALWAEHADQGQNTLVIDDDDLISGEMMTFTATGHRQDVQGSAGGETRFIPVSWTIESVLPFLPFANQHPFTGSYVTNAPGTYTLTAVFVEEFYNICCGTWDPTGQCVSLSAPFTVRAPGAYAVVYDGNGHDGGTVPVDALAYAKDDAVTVAAGEPTKAGHVFAGWKADHDGKVYRAGDTFAMPEGGARLVAQWTPQAAPGPNGQLAKPGTPAALSKAGFLPKTGDEAVPFVLLGVAAAAGALGVRSLRRKAE